MPAFDANLMTKTSGDLTGSDSGDAEIRGTGLRGMTARVVVPEAYNNNDTLQVKVHVSDDDTTYTLLAQSAVTKDLAAGGEILVPFVTDKKYGRIELVTTSTTAANIDFGAVKAGFVSGAFTAWDR
jgi:hypothetical protein